jgi:citrate lyase subunit beta/citryl-CoA lyase
MSDDIQPPQIQRPLRSALFVPGDKPRAIEKAPGLGADALMLDLEDAVAADAKPAARAAAPAAIAGFKAGGALAVLRIAEPGSTDLEADIQAAVEAQPDIVLIAKTERAEQVSDVRYRLEATGWSGPLWAMIETPRAMLALAGFAHDAAELGLTALVAGANDLADQLRLPEGPGQRDALSPHLAQLVLAARAGGMQVLDGVYNAFRDAEGFMAEAKAGRAQGFDGKTLIHPSQVAPANTAFAPSKAERDWASRVVAAFEDPKNAGKGAIPLEGRMIEAMHLSAARAVLAALND